MLPVYLQDGFSTFGGAAPDQTHHHSGPWALLKAATCFTLVLGLGMPVRCEPIHHITIDGDFSDWATVPSYYDPPGTDVHNGIPNTHDTDGETPDYIPTYVNHPDVDLLEYKFTHDSSNLYAYFRAEGVIGRTISNANQHGRYYVIVTIDVDNSTNTGYNLCEGGYYPTTAGYDMNMEFEFYDGHPNKGNYLNHGATNDASLAAAFQDQMNGIVRVLPGSYDYYPEWVWFDTPSGPGSGTNNLPPPDDYASIRFVKDKGPSYEGIIRIALSPDGHQAEMVAPFRGFMRDATQPHTAAKPIISLGKTFNVSFSLEASGELAPGGEWASNTAEPIRGYYVGAGLPPNLLAVGDNSLGQCGLTMAATNTIAIAAGAWHSLALRADGQVLAWGNDWDGQCDVPPTLQGALAIAAGGYHSLAIRGDGTVAAWGANNVGQTNVPTGLSQVVELAAGAWHSLALRSDGNVVAWGDNSWGQVAVPAGLSNVAAVAAGGNHNLALLTNGFVVAWGENTDAQGNFAGQSVVPWGLANAVAIAAGEYHSLAVKADGTVVAWGDNSQGQCSPPTGLSNVVAVTAGGAHSVALLSDGTLVAWGANWNGQCALPPVGTNVVAAAAGLYQTLVLLDDGTIAPRLLNPESQSNQASMLVQTYQSRNYILECKTALAAETWTALSTNRGNGALKVLIDPGATLAQRFYRVRQE